MIQPSELVWEDAYLGLGANQGNRAMQINEALNKLACLPTIQVKKVSSLYETAPVGIVNQPRFLNAAAHVSTVLTPEALLAQILHVEHLLGRVRAERWGPRMIDIDILAYGNQTIDIPGLKVPHPYLTQRAFALVPLAEVAPELILPGETSAVKILAHNQWELENKVGSTVVSEYNVFAPS